MSESNLPVQAIRWLAAENFGPDGPVLRLLDQTRLPGETVYLDLVTVAEVWQAIKRLSVRGAPAIGIAAAYGVCLACRDTGKRSFSEVMENCRGAAEYLATSRPTAVNLFWALNRINATLDKLDSAWARVTDPDRDNPAGWVLKQLVQTAIAIHDEDRRMCHEIGRIGAELLRDGDNILTHCNTGGLATSEYGTALSVCFTAQDHGKQLHVYVDETRPLLQGARLTAWELMQRKIPCTLICDNMAAHVMATKDVDAVIVGADRIAANGDTANKIGTYNLAVLANFHRIPFYVAAPSSTFDLSIGSGDRIPIEERQSEEITEGFGRRTAPIGVNVYNPAFDVTPGNLIEGIITEKGLIRPVTRAEIERVLQVT
ncbi:MAG: S-methyl-5-thioribose-1-phosphate isomerase [Planctomycetaceae bacterium]|nr:S-methyl-5-thioribose-1-phosphate isomerase [Planctomycetaceae bacterium]